jgi:hypothetical protein
MATAEVLALEIKQYLGQGRRTLVPRVIGQTSAARQTKRGSGPAREWDAESFLTRFEEKERRGRRRHLQQDHRVGRGTRVPSRVRHRNQGPGLLSDPRKRRCAVQSRLPQHLGEGRVRAGLNLKTHPPFHAAETRTKFSQELSAIPRVSADALEQTPTFAFELLEQPSALEGLFKALEWFSETAHTASRSPDAT